jgi:nucleoside 2-deoxyribosyltransferase
MHSEKDSKKLQRNEKIAKILEDNGIELILPQRDVDQTLPKSQILEQELEAIKKSKALIVVLSDTRGIYLEAGYAKALGKKLIGLKVEETRQIETSGWISSFFDYIVSDPKEIIKIIKNKIER